MPDPPVEIQLIHIGAQICFEPQQATEVFLQEKLAFDQPGKLFVEMEDVLGFSSNCVPFEFSLYKICGRDFWNITSFDFVQFLQINRRTPRFLEL